MHKVLVNHLFKLAQEKVWLGELTSYQDLVRRKPDVGVSSHVRLNSACCNVSPDLDPNCFTLIVFLN